MDRIPRRIRGIRFSYPSKSYPPSQIISLKLYCIPQIISHNRIPQIELYRGIRLRDTIEGYDTILRDTIRFEGYDLRDTIKSYPSIFARDTMRDTIVSYPSLFQGLHWVGLLLKWDVAENCGT